MNYPFLDYPAPNRFRSASDIPPKSPKIGDTWFNTKYSIYMIWDGIEWCEVTTISEEPVKLIIKETAMTNCKNCGAPLNKHGNCDYCGTIYNIQPEPESTYIHWEPYYTQQYCQSIQAEINSLNAKISNHAQTQYILNSMNQWRAF